LSYWSTAENDEKTDEQEYQGENTGVYPLRLQQSAYTPKNTTQTATHHVITHIQEKFHLSFLKY